MLNTIVVSAAVIIERGAVLLSRRKKGTHLADRWEFPGGKAEPGEDPRDALKRELVEELGIDCVIGDIAEATFHRYEDAGKAVLLLFFFALRKPGSPEPRALDVAEVKWASGAELDPAEFPPADVAILEKVRRLLG
jgi:8-oxo-dGTP diphosphatase